MTRQTTRSLATTRTMGTIKPYPYDREVFDIARCILDELSMKIQLFIRSRLTREYIQSYDEGLAPSLRGITSVSVLCPSCDLPEA